MKSHFTADTHDCKDAGGRVTQGAVTERTRRKSIKSPQRRNGRKKISNVTTMLFHLGRNYRKFFIIIIFAFLCVLGDFAVMMFFLCVLGVSAVNLH